MTAVNSDPKPTILLTSIWVSNFISLAVTLAFAIRFCQLNQKTVTSYMVFALSLMTWLFPILDIWKFFVLPGVQSAMTVAAIEEAVSYVTIHWTAVIALYTYKRLNSEESQQKWTLFLGVLWCLLVIPIVALPVYFRIWDIYAFFTGRVLIILFPQIGFENKILFFLTYDVFGRFIPLLVVLYYHIKAYKILKNVYGITSSSLTKFIWFGLIPVLLISPATIADVVCLFLGIFRPFGVKLLESCLFRSWGFINLIAFWFPKHSGNARKDTLFSDFQNVSYSQNFVSRTHSLIKNETIHI